MAKIIIFEDGLGRRNGEWADLSDGVYVLLRADFRGDQIWTVMLPNCPAGLRNRFDRECSLGVAPNHGERFAYTRITDDEDTQELAGLVAACSLI
jgi:hypothetical protein